MEDCTARYPDRTGRHCTRHHTRVDKTRPNRATRELSEAEKEVQGCIGNALANIDADIGSCTTAPGTIGD